MKKMTNLIAIFIGGGIGSLLRYSLSLWINHEGKTFPFSTLLANILACLFLGFFTSFFLQKLETLHWFRCFMFIGVCGGFSTFSTFSMETFNLYQQNQLFLAGLYIFVSLACCITSILLGMQIAKIF